MQLYSRAPAALRAGARPAAPLRAPVLRPGLRTRRRELVRLVEAVPAETATTTVPVVPTNGNGKSANAANGNGNGNGNGSSGGGTYVAVPAAASLLAQQQQQRAESHAAASTSTSSSNGNGNGSSSNGNGNGSSSNGSSNGAAAAAVASHPLVASSAAPAPPSPASSMDSMDASTDSVRARGRVINTIDEEQNAAHAGKLALAAATAGDQAPPGAAGPAAAKPRTAAGTPYANPGGRWGRFRRYGVWQRTIEIWSFAIQFAWKYFLLGRKWAYPKKSGGMSAENVSSAKASLAIWLREGLVRLGPTFIKIGQQFSTRIDVLAPEFIKELEKLQDNVPPFETETALAIITQNLGAPPSEVFAEFDETPIAAASLGQVHLAKLKTGERVVVKVQRPGLKSLFDIDLKNVRVLAQWLQKADPKTDGAARDWVAIYDECSRILYEEIDYTMEGKNADAFRANFAGVDWVKVPLVYWQYTTPEVLVLEYCPGKKINDGPAIDALGLDRQRLARLAVESYLQQILRHGLFHADPHPGNVAVDAGVEGGRLIYYDFGMMGRLPNGVRDGLLELFYGVYDKDPDRCLEALVAMGVLVPTGDKMSVRRTAEFFLRSFSDRLDQEKAEREELEKQQAELGFKPQRTKDEAKQRRKQILSAIGEDLLLASNDKPFRFPASLTFTVRSFTVLDGIGKSLDPRFDLTAIAAPFARALLFSSSSPYAPLFNDLKRRSQNQNRAVANLFKAPNALEGVAATVRSLERGELKLRVRALEAERALERVQAWQRVVASALVASTLVNVGTVLSVSAAAAGATASFVGAGFFGLMVVSGYLKIVKLEKKEAQLTGAV